MYCEIRQLITYIKEGHGSVFRRVALSALLDTADRPSKKEANVQTTRVIRHIHHTEMDESCDIPPEAAIAIDEKSVRKLLFKKRSTSSTCAVIYGINHSIITYALTLQLAESAGNGK